MDKLVYKTGKHGTNHTGVEEGYIGDLNIQSINQSIKHIGDLNIQSINQSINQTINKSIINQLINQLTNLSIRNQLLNQAAINRSTNHSIKPQ